MRRNSKGYRRRQAARRPQTDSGTIKSIEHQHGTGSIAPDRDAQVNADTGFTNAAVDQDDFSTLQVGDRVHFSAAPDPDRPGFAHASAVQTAGPADPTDAP